MNGAGHRWVYRRNEAGCGPDRTRTTQPRTNNEVTSTASPTTEAPETWSSYSVTLGSCQSGDYHRHSYRYTVWYSSKGRSSSSYNTASNGCHHHPPATNCKKSYTAVDTSTNPPRQHTRKTTEGCSVIVQPTELTINEGSAREYTIVVTPNSNGLTPDTDFVGNIFANNSQIKRRGGIVSVSDGSTDYLGRPYVTLTGNNWSIPQTVTVKAGEGQIT